MLDVLDAEANKQRCNRGRRKTRGEMEKIKEAREMGKAGNCRPG